MDIKKRKKMKDDGSFALKQRSVSTKLVFGVVFAIFFLYAITLIYPFVILFINSLKDGLEYLGDLSDQNVLGFPDKPLFGNYVDAFTSMTLIDSWGREIGMLEMFFNSLIYAGIASVAPAVCSTLTAYALSKFEFKLKSVLYAISLITLTIPIVSNTASMLKLTNDLGIYNTWTYVLLANFGGFGFNFLVLNGFFKNISWSYAEAAMIDGAGQWRVFLSVMLPQAVPALVSLIVMQFISAWNDYNTILLFLPDFPTLSAGLYRVQLNITRLENGYPVFFAGILLSVIPILILFISFFDMIMQNVSVGGLKG